jgi:hypothetical protein
VTLYLRRMGGTRTPLPFGDFAPTVLVDVECATLIVPRAGRSGTVRPHRATAREFLLLKPGYGLLSSRASSRRDFGCPQLSASTRTSRRTHSR